MTEEKGLDPAVADKIGEWVVLKGQRDLLEKLRSNEELAANQSMKQGMDDLDLMFGYLEAFNSLDAVSFDLSLARGLDYYTGVIYEVVTEGSAPSKTPAPEEVVPAPKKKKSKASSDPDEDRSSDPSVGVGSVAAGGRYDNLVGMFSGKTQIPCVGISFGVDRIFSITAARMAADKSAEQVRNNEVDVYVMAFGGKGFNGLLKERMSVCSTLWEAGIKVRLLPRYIQRAKAPGYGTDVPQAEFLYKVKPKLPNQFKAAEVNGVPFAIILGEDELAQGKVKIKEMGLSDDHPEKEGVLVNLSEIAQEVRQRLNRQEELDELTQTAGGLTVVGGLKGDDVSPAEKAAAVEAAAQPPETLAEDVDVHVPV